MATRPTNKQELLPKNNPNHERVQRQPQTKIENNLKTNNERYDH